MSAATPLEVLCVCEPIFGGVPVYLGQLVRRLEGSEIHFTIACPRESILRRRLADTTVSFADCEMRRGLNPFTELHATLQLWRLLRHSHFDLVHLHSSKAGLLGRMLRPFHRLPTIFTPHCFSFESVPAFHNRFRTYLLAERKLGPATDVLVCVSIHERELALRHGIVPAERIATIPCFVEIARWSPGAYPEELKQRLGIAAGNRVVGTVSRFHAQKAPLDFALTAELVLRQRDDVSFLFIGEDGPLRNDFEQLLQSRGLSSLVQLVPWTDDRSFLKECVALMDVFVLNSLWEGSPLAIIEAMAMERPVATTDIPALREMVQEPGAGLLAAPGNPEAMAANILQLLAEPELAQRLGANGRRRAEEKYSLDLVAERHRNLYLSLARAGAHRG